MTSDGSDSQIPDGKAALGDPSQSAGRATDTGDLGESDSDSDRSLVEVFVGPSSHEVFPSPTKEPKLGSFASRLPKRLRLGVGAVGLGMAVWVLGWLVVSSLSDTDDTSDLYPSEPSTALDFEQQINRSTPSPDSTLGSTNEAGSFESTATRRDQAPTVAPRSVTADRSNPVAADTTGITLEEAERRAGRMVSTLLDSTERKYALLLNTTNGPLVIDSDGYTEPNTSVAVGFKPIESLPLFSDKRATWAIGHSDTWEWYMISSRDDVALIADQHSAIFARRDGSATQVGIGSFGNFVLTVDVPEGSQVLTYPGLGLFVTPRTGGTFVLNDLGDALVQVSPDRLVALSRGGIVLERCDDTMVCTAELSRLDVSELESGDPLPKFGSASNTPVELASSTFLSPDARWILQVRGPGGTHLKSTESNFSWQFDDEDIDHAAWAQDSSVVALLRSETVQFVVPAHPGTSASGTITLPESPIGDTISVASRSTSTNAP